jgi:DNA-binding NtrC family response regulator
VIDLWAAALSAEKILVSGSTSIEEARRQMEQQEYDVVLIDFPLELAAELAGTQSHRATRFAVLVEENAVVPHSLSLEITVFPKSAPLGELLHGIRSILGLTVQSSPPNTAGHLLAVDDEDAIRSMLVKFLSQRGYLVQGASNGKEALRMIATDPSFDVVLLDLSMPGMGGMEVLAALMKQRARPQVIVLSGIADSEIARSAVKMGFDFIQKPFDMHAVESTVSTCLSHTHYAKRPWWKLRSSPEE